MALNKWQGLGSDGRAGIGALKKGPILGSNERVEVSV